MPFVIMHSFAEIFTVLALGLWVAGASTDCNNLVRYLKPEDTNLIFGNWTVLIAAADEPLHRTLQQRSSSWFELKPTSASNRVVNFQIRERIAGVCTYGSENSTAHGENAVLSVESELYKGQYLHTCQGCLQGVTRAEVNGLSGRYFYLAKQGGNLTELERQTFERQAECLNLPPVYFTFPNASELCPEQEAADGNVKGGNMDIIT